MRTCIVVLENLVLLGWCQFNVDVFPLVDELPGEDPISAQLKVVFLRYEIHCFFQTEHLQLIVSFVFLCLSEEELRNFFVEPWHRLWGQVNLLR